MTNPPTKQPAFDPVVLATIKECAAGCRKVCITYLKGRGKQSGPRRTIEPYSLARGQAGLLLLAFEDWPGSEFRYFSLHKIVAAEDMGPEHLFDPRREVTIHTGRILDSAEDLVPPVTDTPLTTDGVASGTILVQQPLPAAKGCLGSLAMMAALLCLAALAATASLSPWR